MCRRLADYLTPITTGLEPASAAQSLNRDRAAELAARLDDLRRARRDAWLALRGVA